MEPWKINVRHQRAFVKTVETGTVQAAAKAVSLSQSAVTQALAKLESQLDTRLFERLSHGMEATEAAIKIYPRFVTSLGYIRNPSVTHTQIRAFLALSRGGSYADAAGLTGLATASLHRAVRDMEIVLGHRLVQRRGRGVELTDLGVRTARRYSLAMTELRYAIEDVNAMKGRPSGRIAVGAMPLCRARVLPAAIVALQKTGKGSDIFVAEGSYHELVEPLRNGDLDFLIGAMRQPSPGPDLIQDPLFEDQPVVVARAEHPLLRLGRELDIKLLSAYPWCVPAKGVPLRDRWEMLFKDHNIALPHIAVECGSVMTNRQILIHTDCLTLVSPDQVAVELEAGWLQVVCDLPDDLKRVIGLTYREGWSPTETQNRFMAALREVASKNSH